jgi:tetratricopeptide (TPR) repeat protein
MVTALRALGAAAGDLDDFALAKASFADALVLYRELDDRHGTAVMLNNLGVVEYLSGGDLRRAVHTLGDALQQAQVLSDQLLIGHITLNIGDLARDHQNDPERAASAYREALRLLWEGGNRSVLPHALAAVAVLAAMNGRHDQSTRLIGVTAGLCEATGARIPASEQARVDQTVATVRESLGEAAFATAWEAGRALSLGEAVIEALAVTRVVAGETAGAGA